MTKKIFGSIFFVSLISVLVASALVIGVLYGVMNDSQADHLRSEAIYVARALEGARDQDAYLAAVASAQSRVTLISPEGEVLFDSDADAAAMENHVYRPEVDQALSTGTGSAARYSATLGEQTFYYALRLESGEVLRVAADQLSVFGLLSNMVVLLAIILVGVAILTGVLASRASREIVKPINELDLSQPMSNSDAYEEISPLLSRIERQRKSIREQIDNITRQQLEFDAVVDHMREGLVLLDPTGSILSINRAAVRLFGGDKALLLGNSLLAADRSPATQAILQKAIEGKPGEEVLVLDGHYYEIFANPLGEEGGEGTVLFLVNIDEKRAGEQQRREFSANVSHELKTPLTSISGYAEIMKNGVAAPEDMPGFATRIFEESTRLIRLIDDIIRLSHLDEREIMEQREDLSLRELAQEALEGLGPAVERHNVRVDIAGDAHIFGVRRIVGELVANLMDNAVKYNKEGGQVDVRAAQAGGEAVFSVADTGIGIPREHRDKVFQRFYRVDKSHSKDTGGTGLGLAIVKHSAAVHNARVELESEEGKGTTVRVVFPTGR